MKSLLFILISIFIIAGAFTPVQAAARSAKVEGLLEPAVRLAQQGKYAEAEALCSKVIKKHPRSASAHTLRANLRMRQGKSDSALKDANRAIRLAPKWAGGRTSRAMVRMALGQTEPALKDLAAAISNAANDPDQAKEYRLALFYRADFYIRAGQLDKALTDLNRILKSKPDQVSALYSRGNTYLKLGRYEDAARDLNNVVASGLEGTPLAGVLTGLAQAEANMGRTAFGLEYIDQALAISPENPLMHSIRGQILKKLDEHEKAVEAFNQAISLEPRYLTAIKDRGGSYMALGKYDEAEDDFAQLIIQGKGRMAKVQGHLLRSQSFFMRRMYQEALDDLEQIIRMLPHKSLGYAEMARFLAACPDSEFRDGKRALEMAQKALSMSETPDTLAVLAAAKAELGEFDQAVQIQQRALNLLEESGAPYRLTLYFKEQLQEYQAQKPYRLEVPWWGGLLGAR